MKTVSLSMGEMINILDQFTEDAYNNLQRALEGKASAQIGEDKWLDVWNSDDWRVTLTLEYTEKDLA